MPPKWVFAGFDSYTPSNSASLDPLNSVPNCISVGTAVSAHLTAERVCPFPLKIALRIGGSGPRVHPGPGKSFIVKGAN